MTVSNFVKQTSFPVGYAPAHISKWRSSRTGLQLTYIDQPSPMVNGYFAVATEIENDSGCPHTLEHLVFMGSHKYPYKGLLDNLGNRFFSSTNAWTAVDQTVYTLTTAGWEGFKTLLPIYLDHLFRPTLTDEGCLTEVYHIDGHGHEKGVVFSEMQGIESQSWFITFLNLLRSLYRQSSGYSSETGGLMAELRKLTNNDIRKFHAENYRPDNLCVVVTGSVDEQELLEIMDNIDGELPSLGAPNKRPFVDSQPDEPLQKTTVKEVQFPDTDESMGEVLLAWIGPPANDVVLNVAVDLLGSYFSDSAISVFNRALVEVENPLATDVDYSTNDYVRTGIIFSFSGVPTESLHEVDDKVKELIQHHSKPENFDLKYMHELIYQQRLKFVSKCEKSASTFSNIAIEEFIYGNVDGSDLRRWTQNLDEYDLVAAWNAEKWASVIHEQLVANHLISILGKPSSSLAEQQEKENKKISRDIMEKYGKSGLKKLGDQLQKAQDFNDREIPTDVLTQFGQPDPEKIAFIETKSYRGGSNQEDGPYVNNKQSEAIESDTPADFPLFLHFEEFKSLFTTVHVVMPSSLIDTGLLRYMAIVEEIFSLPIELPDGTSMTHNEVVAALNNDFVDFELDNGFDNQFQELITIKVKFKVTNYHTAISWLVKVMQHAVFDMQRVKIILEKIINSLPDEKRSGELMMYSCQFRTLFDKRSLKKAQDCILNEQFYKDLLEQIEGGDFAAIEHDLNRLRKQLFNLDGMKVFILGNLADLKNPVSSWVPFVDLIRGTGVTIPFEELPRSHMYRSDVGLNMADRAYIVSTPASESTHISVSTAIPTDYLDEDIFKIALASEFFTAVEGPFWRGIRGTGLAYGASIRRDLESGFLSYIVYRGSDGIGAWLTARNIVNDYASGKLEFDSINMENSIAAIVNALADGEANSYDAASSKVADNVFKRRGPEYVRFFLRKLRLVSAADLVEITKKYFVPMFDTHHSVVFASVPPAKVSEYDAYFSDRGYSVTIEEIGGDLSDASGQSDSGSGSEASDDSEGSEGSGSDSELE